MKIRSSSLVILMLLMLFPFISWLYLKNGIGFRKVALSELSEKSSFDLSLFSTIDSQLLVGKIILIDVSGSAANTANIYDQFKESTDFTILSHNSGYSYQLDSLTRSKLLATFGESDYILVDNEGFKRNSYSNSMKDMKKAVIHIATLIPFVEKKKPRGIK